jgi:imidazolonepropionase
LASLTLVRARTIVPCDTAVAQNGVTFEGLGRIDGGAMLIADGRVAAVGPRKEIERVALGRNVEAIDLGDAIVVPGLVDAHAHPLFDGDREPDFAARIRGEKPALGMGHTVARTRQALCDVERFRREVLGPRLETIFAHGTTTLETKTGYALTRDGELQLLDVIAGFSAEPGVPRLVATFLGAHALPPEFASFDPYVDYLIAEVLPQVAKHGARYVDAFCEPGFFSPEQTRRYLEAAHSYGLRERVHCDEMAYGRAAAMACERGVDAVDHCNYIREADVEQIVARGIVTVACPATIAYLGLEGRAPVRALLERGGEVAIASDYNPGTSPCFNLQTVAYFGRALFGMTAAEALFAVTRAAARSLRAAAGSLAVGAPADFVALALGSPEEFGWQFGGNLAVRVSRGA